MITAAELTGILTAPQYAALQAVIDSTTAATPTIRCRLHQYAPVWSAASVPGPLSTVLDAQTTYTATQTGPGNWRLFSDSSGSDIYWPFQVRSIDAVSLDDYDLIAMVTDLPPIVDTTVSAQKSSFSYQRVQGIVLWKYTPATGQWSDHWTWDVCDSTQEEARSNVKLTRDGAYVYMTYGKTYGGIHGLAITRSVDGLNWENPIIYNASTTVQPVKTALARDGDYMYLVFAGSPLTCVRSVATDFMGTPAAAATQDITDYVLGVSLTQGAARALTVELANPDDVLTTSGLLALRVATRLSFEAGYRLSDGTLARVPILTGDITEWSVSQQLPVKHLSVQVKDSLSLLEAIGSSEAVEWQSLIAVGDNYCPINTDDKTGATGLSRSQIRGGTWVGTQTGVKFECDGRERLLLSTFESRVFNGLVSSEWSFYQPVTAVNMATGSSGTETAVGTEYAGIVFRYLDDHNCWLVRVSPAGQVELVRRLENPANEHLHDATYVPRNHTQYAAMHLDTVLATANITLNGSYWPYYPGRITVEWKYGRVRVWHNYPGGASTQLIAYEVPGFGNTPYTNQASPIVSGHVGHVVYSPKDGTLEIAPNGDALSGTTYWVAENMSQANVTRVNDHSRTDENTDCSPWVIKVVTESDGPDPGVFYRRGSVGSPLNIAGGPHLDFSGYVYLDSGDQGLAGINDASVCIKAKIYYTDDPDDKPSQKAGKTWVTTLGTWNAWSWSVDTLPGRTIRRYEVSFVDQRGRDFRVAATTFYVADLHVKQTVDEVHAYVNNVDLVDVRPVWTVHDALTALYAFAGSHLIDRSALVNSSAFSGYTTPDVPLPYVVECDINASSGTLYLTGSTNPLRFVWAAGYCGLALGSNSFYRRVARTISQGRLRVAVTSASSEGKTFTNDLNSICDWVTVAVYLDDAFVLSGVVPISGTRTPGASLTDYASADIGGFKLGSLNTVANFRVDQLHRHIPYFSVDPAEQVSAGVSRIIGVSRSVAMYRFNQHILIGRPPLTPDTGSPAWTLPTALATRSQGAYNAVVPVHFRLIGAWTEKEQVDPAGMHAAWRHYFFKKDDPNLMTTDEMRVEADYLMNDLKYARDRLSLSVKFNPLVELNDVIAAGGEFYLLDQAQWSFQRDGAGALKSTGSIVLKLISG